jgi:transcriptional regulator with XRE-family HTH domain
MAKVGRPRSYDKKVTDLDLLYKLALLGLTNQELADFYDVAMSTLSLWIKNEKEFSETLKRGRELADADVANSLRREASGYRYYTKTITKKKKSGEVVEETVPATEDEFNAAGGTLTIQEHYARPNTTAQFFWLQNRQPHLWQNKKNVHVSSPDKSMAKIAKMLRKRDK